MKIYDFGQGIPECVQNKGGELSVTTLAVKQGSGSLKWDFRHGDQLIFDTEIGYRSREQNCHDSRVYAFFMYLYGISASGSLHIGFCKGGIEKTGFDVILNFDGWRSVSACFDRDMNGMPEEEMDRLVISACGSGSVLFSEVVTANKVDQRLVWKSYQTPEINYNAGVAKKDWKLREKYQNIPVDRISLETIKKNVKEYVKAEFVDSKTWNFYELKNRVIHLELRRNELGVTGKRLEYLNQRKFVAGTPWEKEEYVNLYGYTNLMLSLAACYSQSENPEAEELYLLMLEHLVNQGFAEGSSFGTQMVLFYGLRPFYFSVALMFEVLERSGWADKLVGAMLWFLHAARMGFTDDVPEAKASSDSFLNNARGVLIAILLVKDESKQAGFLAAYKDWVDRNLAYGTGLNGILKEDGCIFHHCGHYIAYGDGGLKGMTFAMYALNGSAFAVSQQTYENVRNVLQTLRFQCHGANVPVVFAGRHPHGKMVISVENYKYFALCAMERGDGEAVRWYCELSGEPTDEVDERLFEWHKKHGNAKSDSICVEGNRSYPMACACVHRRNNLMAVARGYSRYLWGSEIYEANNLYGRYRSYGVLELINEKSHFSHDGYDWNRFPGATAIHLPMEKLRANVFNVDIHSGFEEMLLSDQSFAGSVSLGGNGMFSMILSEHPKYNGTHRARKSIFFHDDFILLLGSGISNEAEYETETTLYQISREAAVDVPKINGAPIGELRYEIEEGDVLTDSCGNHYYIKPGTLISLSLGEQVSKSSTDDSETRGEFATAVIRHGVSPKDETYEYGIGVEGAVRPDYQILRQDDAVHAVKIGNVTYAAIFEPKACKHMNVNRPVLLMAEESADGITLAVCDPDLGLYDEDPTQFDENGVQKEVSIYSRTWKSNPVGEKHMRLEIKEFGFIVEQNVKGGSVYTYHIRVN